MCDAPCGGCRWPEDRGLSCLKLKVTLALNTNVNRRPHPGRISDKVPISQRSEGQVQGAPDF